MGGIFMSLQFPLLSLLIWLPIVFGGSMLLLARINSSATYGRYLPLFASLITMCLIGYTWGNFNLDISTMQFTEARDWLPTLGIDYALGVDGFALLLVALTIFMTMIVIIAALTHVAREEYLKYCATFLIMQGLMTGVFLATDAILFYVFFEGMMIPMFLIIGIWGGANRIYATIKFILYTLFGSLFLLIALLYLNHLTNINAPGGMLETFAIANFQTLPIDFATQKWLFWAILFGFAIKIPMWPVHTWLPDAHVEAPTGGSVILAAITLKIGGYGMLRFLLPIVPDACTYFAPIVIALSLIAIAYIGLVTIVQLDLKKLIAYSSIAHMGFVTLGFFIAFSIKDPALSIEGAVLQMIAHGFISGALFLCVGVLYVRMHTREIKDYGGVVNSMPIYAGFFMLFALANVGMPGTVGFVGEFLVILASFGANFWYAVIAGSALILSVAYTLWMYKRVVFGAIVNNQVSLLSDLAINERIVFVLLAGAILLFGVWPNPLLNVMRASSQHLATQLVKTP
jgi:NADH-quinone oxidoreductase subunit M